MRNATPDNAVPHTRQARGARRRVVRSPQRSAQRPGAPESPTSTTAPAAPSSSDTPTFEELGVHPSLCAALARRGITHTFAIQELTLPLALKGSDLIGQARTGMGKTYGFGVPTLHYVADLLAEEEREAPGTSREPGAPLALIVVPTRELCLQVESDLSLASTDLDLIVRPIYGGRPYEEQIEQLATGVDVVVGTPGRLLDLAQQGYLHLDTVSTLVLDEADEMLDLGFLPDIERILSLTPTDRQTMLFSATMPGPIVGLARRFLYKPTHVRAESMESSTVHERTTQHVYRTHGMNKADLVTRILQARGRGRTMVFTRTKRSAARLAEILAERGFGVAAVHGDLPQAGREQALGAFRNRSVEVLVATDVAARGIDVDDVTHVINYQCPDDDKTYVHRVGRTGRAGRTGVAVTLVDWDDLRRWAAIDTALGLGIPDPVETYHTSPHLYAELGIPEDAKDTVGPATTAIGAVPTGERPRRGERGASSDRQSIDRGSSRHGDSDTSRGRSSRRSGGRGGRR